MDLYPLFNLERSVMEKEIEELIRKPLLDESIELIDVKWGEEDNEKTLFVTIDCDDVSTCEKATRIINPIIDNINIDFPYTLDVGSKGE